MKEWEAAALQQQTRSAPPVKTNTLVVSTTTTSARVVQSATLVSQVYSGHFLIQIWEAISLHMLSYLCVLLKDWSHKARHFRRPKSKTGLLFQWLVSPGTDGRTFKGKQVCTAWKLVSSVLLINCSLQSFLHTIDGHWVIKFFFLSNFLSFTCPLFCCC